MGATASFLLGLLFGTGFGVGLSGFVRGYRRAVQPQPVEHDAERLRVRGVAPVIRLRNAHDRSLSRRGR